MQLSYINYDGNRALHAPTSNLTIASDMLDRMCLSFVLSHQIIPNEQLLVIEVTRSELVSFEATWEDAILTVATMPLFLFFKPDAYAPERADIHKELELGLNRALGAEDAEVYRLSSYYIERLVFCLHARLLNDIQSSAESLLSDYRALEGKIYSLNGRMSGNAALIARWQELKKRIADFQRKLTSAFVDIPSSRVPEDALHTDIWENSSVINTEIMMNNVRAAHEKFPEIEGMIMGLREDADTLRCL